MHFYKHFGFSLSVSLQQCSVHIHSSTTNVTVKISESEESLSVSCKQLSFHSKPRCCMQKIAASRKKREQTWLQVMEIFSPPFKVSMEGAVPVGQVTYIDEVPTGGQETTNFSPTLFKALYSSFFFLFLSLPTSLKFHLKEWTLTSNSTQLKLFEIRNGPHTVEILSLIQKRATPYPTCYGEVKYKNVRCPEERLANGQTLIMAHRNNKSLSLL